MQFNDQGIKGPDVSFYQGDPRNSQFIDFQKMKDYGVNFVIIKAGQYTYVDPAFKVNWSGAKDVGIPRAAYWFLDYRDSGKIQAERFWSLLQADPGEGPLIVDFETGSGTWGILYDFVVRLQTLSKYPANRIWIYTGYYYWLDFGPKAPYERSWFSIYGLWLAWYGSVAQDVKVPPPWGTVTMWQMGTTIVWGPDLGVHSLELDWNSFNGDMAEFKKYWITDYVPPIPEEGDNMEYEVVWSKGVAKRTKPTTSNSYTGLVISFGATVEVVEENIPDGDDPLNQNKVWVRLADGYFAASSYPDSTGPAVRMVKVNEPTPKPGRKIIKGVLHFDDNTTLELFPNG
jgi:GH25 family lysozyme M1 (1,4-beta-N-acetylmuramidase)